MLNISSADAKNDFSNVLKQVQQGESFVIEYGRKHKKIAKIIPYQEAEIKAKAKVKPIKVGLYKGKFHAEFADDWAMTDEELLGLE